MKRLLIFTQLMTSFIGVVFIVISLSMYFRGMAFFEVFLDSLIMFLPGLMIMGILVFFRTYYRIGGIVYLGIAMIYYFLLSPYFYLLQEWPWIVFVVFSLMFSGIVHLFYPTRLGIRDKH